MRPYLFENFNIIILHSLVPILLKCVCFYNKISIVLLNLSSFWIFSQKQSRVFSRLLIVICYYLTKDNISKDKLINYYRAVCPGKKVKEKYKFLSEITRNDFKVCFAHCAHFYKRINYWVYRGNQLSIVMLN